MTPATLIRLCEEIYTPERGENWKSQAAIDLGVPRRTFTRWIAGKADIPEGVKDDLRKIGKAYAELRAKLEKIT